MIINRPFFLYHPIMDTLTFQNRKPHRLACWDYSTEGCYFVTFCTHQRAHLFGHVQMASTCLEPNKMVPNSYGVMCEKAIELAPTKNPLIFIDAFIVMPNHVHILMTLNKQDGLQYRSTLSRAVGSIKAATSRTMRQQGYSGKVWQAGYYDHIVRDEKDYERIYTYIENNPSKWLLDRFYE